MKRQHLLAQYSAAAVVALLLTASDHCRAATIRFKSQATVSAPVVTLGDVADVFSIDPGLEKQLESLMLRPAPPIGEKLRLKFSTIRSRLHARGLDQADLNFTGSSIVTVRRDDGGRSDNGSKAAPREARAGPSTIKKAEEAATAAIRQYLGATNSAGTTIDVRIDTGSARLLASARPSDLRVAGGGPPWDTWQPVTIQILGPEGRMHRAEVACRVLRRPAVPMVVRTIRRGETLRAEDVAMRPSEQPVTGRVGLREIIGRETTRTLRPGRPIRADDVREVPLVRSGDIVTVYSRIGAIVVRRDFKARSDGAMGDRVKLVSLNGRERIEATVTGYHEAEVTPTGAAAENRPAYQGRIRFEHPAADDLRNRPADSSAEPGDIAGRTVPLIPSSHRE